MILYNTTFHHDVAITNDLLSWLRSDFIPRASAFGFTDPMLSRIIMPQGEDEVEAYALGLKCTDTDIINRWESTDGAVLLSAMFDWWGEKALAFSTPMQLLDL